MQDRLAVDAYIHINNCGHTMMLQTARGCSKVQTALDASVLVGGCKQTCRASVDHAHVAQGARVDGTCMYDSACVHSGKRHRIALALDS